MAEIRRSSGVVQEQRAIWMVVRLCLFLTFPAALPGAQEANRSRRFGPDSCGPVDPAYIRIADETGGLPMFLQPSEAGKATHFMRESSGENHVTLFWATGRLQGARREFTVPVDSSVQRTTFSLSTDTKGTLMTLLRPSGEAVVPGAAGVEITELNCGRVVTVATPEAGDWRAQVAGSGRFWLEAGGKSEIFLVSVEFVRLGGRPGHEGYFRIPGQPIGGQAATLQVTFSGPAKTAGFELVSEDGEVIQPIPLRREGAGDASDGQDHPLNGEYYGSFELPVEPFRVAVTGRDEKGHAYQRYFHTLFRAENVEVLPPLDLEDLAPGKTTTINYSVRNVGPPAPFRILVYDTRHFVTRVEPRELTLDTGASATVEIDVVVPPDTQPGIGSDLTVTATSIADPTTTNGSSKHLSVFATTNP